MNKLIELPLTDFVNTVASDAPVPGGGSVSALNGAIALALTEMVANLTIGRKKYTDQEDSMIAIAKDAIMIREKMLEFIDKDSEAYDKVFNAFKLPKDTDEQRVVRSATIQEATKIAANIPLEVAETMLQVMDEIAYVAHYGNQNAITDATVAMMMARTCVLGALLNVKINLTSIKDKVYVDDISNSVNSIEAEAIKIEKELLDWIKTKF